MEVGIRELRADLSRYLKRVREGEEIIVTDRGTPIARITPASARSRIDELIAAGVLTPPVNRGPRAMPEPLKVAGTVSDLVADQRR